LDDLLVISRLEQKTHTSVHMILVEIESEWKFMWKEGCGREREREREREGWVEMRRKWVEMDFKEEKERTSEERSTISPRNSLIATTIRKIEKNSRNSHQQRGKTQFSFVKQSLGSTMKTNGKRWRILEGEGCLQVQHRIIFWIFLTDFRGIGLLFGGSYWNRMNKHSTIGEERCHCHRRLTQPMVGEDPLGSGCRIWVSDLGDP
jgi:hypothetical protein